MLLNGAKYCRKVQPLSSVQQGYRRHRGMFMSQGERNVVLTFGYKVSDDDENSDVRAIRSLNITVSGCCHACRC